MLLDLEDFPQPVITAFEIYNMLPDIYVDSMKGAIFLGKDISQAPRLLPIYDVSDIDERRLALRVLKKINDRVRKKSFAKAKNNSNPAGKPPRV